MATAFVSSGVVSSGVVVTNGNTLEFQSGGTASATSVESGGTEQVDFGGVADGTIVSHGGVADVYGLDSAAQVHGILDVFSGGYASGDTVRDGGVMGVASSGFVSATTVLNDGLLFINSGASAGGVTVSSGGLQQVSAGGSASGTIVLSGGLEQVFGADSAGQISGTLEAFGGGLVTGDAIYAGSLIVHSGGTASLTVISGGTMELEVGANASGAITFAASGGTLRIDGTLMPSATISGLQRGNQIDFADVAFVSGAAATIVSGSILRITDGGQQYDLNLAPGADYSGMTFSVVSAGNGIEVDVTCFAPGTHISTPAGETLVEALKPGDLVRISDGRTVPVRWLGRQTISTRFGNPMRVLPIRIRAGAFGENLPCRDLLVSPDHALLVEDMLVQAGAMVNNISIVRENRVPECFTHFHIELDEHALVLAENTPAETFVDNVDRLRFDNWDEHEALYPNGKLIAEMAYPRAKSHRQVPPRSRARLITLAGALYPALAERA